MKMISRLVFLTAFIVLFTVSTPALAENVSVGFSLGNSDFEDVDAGTGFKLYGAMELDELLSIEVGFASLGKYDESFTIPFFGTIDEEITSYALYGDVIARAPLDAEKKFNVFGKLGLALYSTEYDIKIFGISDSTSETGIGLKYGIGASYDIDETISVRAEFENYDVDFDAELLSIGITMAL